MTMTIKFFIHFLDQVDDKLKPNRPSEYSEVQHTVLTQAKFLVPLEQKSAQVRMEQNLNHNTTTQE